MQEPKKILWMGVGGIFLVLVFSWIVKQLFFSQPRQITVVATGTEQVDAKKAVFVAVVSETNADRRSAVSRGNERIAQLITTLKRESSTSEIRTTSATITQTNASGTYQYSSGVEIRVSGQPEMKKVLQLLQNENVGVAQVRYLPSDDISVSNKARIQALESAKQKAASLAQLSKGKLGNVVSVVEQQSNETIGSGVTNSGVLDGELQDQSTNIQISVTLTVTYQLR